MFHDTVGGFIIIQHTGVDKMIHCDECKYFRAMTINPYMPRHSDTCLYPKNLGTWKSADEPKRGPSYINKRHVRMDTDECVYVSRVTGQPVAEPFRYGYFA